MENYKAVIRSKENGSAKFLLKQGMIPGVVYGKGGEPRRLPRTGRYDRPDTAHRPTRHARAHPA